MTYTHEEYITLLEQIRWNGKPKCPYCASMSSRKLKNEHRYQCNECFTSYSVTVGTFLQQTHVDLHKWFVAIRLILNSPGGISVRQLAKEIGVNKNTACYMMERVRKAMKEEEELLRNLLELNKP